MRYFEDISAGESVDLGSITIGEDEILEFGRRYDPQPFHVDPHAALATSFGGLVASGWQTGGLYMRLLVDGFLHDVASMGAAALEEVRWLRPVRPDDTLTARFTVLATRPSQSKPDRGVVHSRGEMWNQHGELVFVVRSVNIVGRRPAAGAHRDAVAGTSGALTGLFDQDHLSRLREDWPE